MLEWAFKVRARRSHVRRTNEDRAPGNVVGRPPGNMEASRVRLVWSSRLLPWVRRHFPGGKLQLLATRPS
jgi:hypothetical protein